MTAGIGAGVGAEGDGGSRRGHGMSAKERAKSVELSSGCRRCLNCEALYDLVSFFSLFLGVLQGVFFIWPFVTSLGSWLCRVSYFSCVPFSIN